MWGWGGGPGRQACTVLCLYPLVTLSIWQGPKPAVLLAAGGQHTTPHWQQAVTESCSQSGIAHPLILCCLLLFPLYCCYCCCCCCCYCSCCCCFTGRCCRRCWAGSQVVQRQQQQQQQQQQQASDEGWEQQHAMQRWLLRPTLRVKHTREQEQTVRGGEGE